jgi:alanine racemase
VEGFSTHIASSEVLDAPSVNEQLEVFESAKQVLDDYDFHPPLIHAANTSAVISHHESWNTMIRPGLALYGYYLPFERAGRVVSGAGLKLQVKPALTWKTRILSLRDMRAGQALGYGGTYVTKAPSRIAVLPVGYADGLNRGLSEGGRVIVREHYAPIVGRISMDLTLVDVTGIPGVAVTDEVILLGSLDGLSVDARVHADLAHTIPYEILCAISKRVPRKYGA